MNRIDDFFEKKYNCDLLYALFKVVQNEDDKEKFEFYDGVKFIDREKNVVKFSLERNITINTIVLRVKFEFERFLLNEKLEMDFENFLLDLTNEELSELGGAVFDRVSHLIAQLTSADGNRPLITGPTYYAKNDD